MSSRTARASLVAFLLIVGAAGGYLGYDTSQRHAAAFTQEREVLSRLDAMLASVNELAVTQRGYFEPRTGNAGAANPQFQRVRQLTDELKEHLTALRSRLTSPEAIEKVAGLATALDDFSTTDTRVRTNLANDTYFSAADLVFSASATELRSVTGALIALKGITTAEAITQYGSLQRRAALVAATVGLVWTVGLLLLVRTPAQERSEAAADLSLISTEAAERDAPAEPAAPLAAAADTPRAIDLEATARVCTAIASATSAAGLREIMADAASTVGASGMVVWLGAGEELFPVLGHGYDPRMLSRIGPLARQAANATAIAWRTAEAQVVPGEDGRAGAVVVPLVSAQGCIGVLSAEVASGRETEVAVRSVITLFAAQLSAIVAAWPEPSATANDETATSTGTIAVTL